MTQSGCCGPVKDRVELIKTVSRNLHLGHMGVAKLYSEIAKDIEDPKERKLYIESSRMHLFMAEESLLVVQPDEGDDGEGSTVPNQQAIAV